MGANGRLNGHLIQSVAISQLDLRYKVLKRKSRYSSEV